MNLYKIYLVYGENRVKPEVLEELVVGETVEDAKIKSSLIKQIKSEWDVDFITIVADFVGEIAVKERPTEVKSV